MTKGNYVVNESESRIYTRQDWDVRDYVIVDSREQRTNYLLDLFVLSPFVLLPSIFFLSLLFLLFFFFHFHKNDTTLPHLYSLKTPSDF